MLKNYNDSYFINRGITEKGSIFFLQRWLEIFEPKTLDTYQYSITNVVVGMREYLEVIDKTIDGTFTSIDNVDACKKELLRTFNDDDIIKKHMPGLSDRIRNHLGITIKKEDRAKLLRAKSEIKYAIKLIEPEYQKLLMDELLNDIKKNNFDKIQSHIKVLASFCIYNGWTPYGASNLVNRIFLSTKEFEIDSLWDEFYQELSKEQECKVYINLKMNAKGASKTDAEVIRLVESLGLQILNYEQIVFEHKSIEQKKLPIRKEKKYMVFIIKAKDVKAAALKAVGELNNKVTILPFYNIIKSWSLNDLDGFVVVDQTSYIWQFKIEDLYKTHLFLDSSNRVFENAMKVYSNSSNTELKSTQIALRGVFNYANISLVSVFPEEKFMNLWIAIESFMRTGQYSNIISHIKEVLPAIVCKRYIYRIIRNLAEDCIRCKVNLQLSTRTIELDNETKQSMVKELISALRNDVEYEEIKSICSDNTLLLYRLEEIRTILKDNKSVIEKVRRYNETVSWHIQRLYRIRNEIAHSGLKENNYLVTYIEHIYDYLGILITEIVFVCSNEKIVAIDEIFPMLKDNYDAFDGMLQGSKMLINEFQLDDGIIDCL